MGRSDWPGSRLPAPEEPQPYRPASPKHPQPSSNWCDRRRPPRPGPAPLPFLPGVQHGSTRPRVRERSSPRAREIRCGAPSGRPGGPAGRRPLPGRQRDSATTGSGPPGPQDRRGLHGPGIVPAPLGRRPHHQAVPSRSREDTNTLQALRPPEAGPAPGPLRPPPSSSSPPRPGEHDPVLEAGQRQRVQVSPQGDTGLPETPGPQLGLDGIRNRQRGGRRERSRRL